MAQGCSRQRSVILRPSAGPKGVSAVPERVQLYLGVSRRVLTVLSGVPESVQLYSAVSRRVFSCTQPCPGDCSAVLSRVSESVQLYSVLSRRVFSCTQRCPGESNKLDFLYLRAVDPAPHGSRREKFSNKNQKCKESCNNCKFIQFLKVNFTSFIVSYF